MVSTLSNSSFAQRFGLSTPIACAPMALATGGELAAASARAGALGLVGGAYGDLAWTSREYGLALELLNSEEALSRLGCGFISWKLAEDRSALDWLLDQEHKPAAVMLSFGDPQPFANDITERGIPLICQIQSIAQLPEAVDAGASVIVAQGAEAGGHGLTSREGRSTFTIVPEVADWLAANAPEVDLLAAGGIADGRGLAAALMLGADGALIGSRLWATEESLAPDAAIERAVEADGDGTGRSAVFDILRRKNWPAHFDFRALRNALYDKWEGRIEELRADPTTAIAEYDAGLAAGDYDRAHVTVGEGTGLIRANSRAGEVIRAIDAEARRLFASDGG